MTATKDRDYNLFGPDKVVYGAQGPQVTYYTGGLGSIVVILSAFFAAVIITALIRSEWSALAAIVTGGIYFGLITLAALLILSGTLSQIVVSHQEQRTLRLQIVTATQLQLPDPATLQLPDMPAIADRLQPPGSTFVAPVDSSEYREGLAYVAQLYGADGLPDGKKVVKEAQDKRQEGRLRIANPSKDTLSWLVSRGVIQPIMRGSSINGYRLNLDFCPTLAAAHTALRQRYPVPSTSGGVGG